MSRCRISSTQRNRERGRNRERVERTKVWKREEWVKGWVSKTFGTSLRLSCAQPVSGWVPGWVFAAKERAQERESKGSTSSVRREGVKSSIFFYNLRAAVNFVTSSIWTVFPFVSKKHFCRWHKLQPLPCCLSPLAPELFVSLARKWQSIFLRFLCNMDTDYLSMSIWCGRGKE